MAAPTRSRPVRALVILAVIVAGILAWALWPGSTGIPKLGLDLQGGTQVILRPTPVKEGQEITDAQLQQTATILRQRVDSVGVAEAEVAVQGSGNNAAIIVSVPGVSQERIIDLVGRTALLDFRPVWDLLPPGGGTPTPEPTPTTTETAAPEPSDSGSPSPSDAPSPSPTASDSATPPGPPAEDQPSPTPSPTASSDEPVLPKPIQAKDGKTDEVYKTKLAELDCLDPINTAGGLPDDPDLWLATCDRSGGAKYNLQPAFIKGTQVTGASASLQQSGLGWVVNLQFDSDGAKALSQVSRELSALPDCGQGQSPCNAFAIVLDGVVVSAPRFNEPITGGQAQIEGNFTSQEAQDLANVLQYGALPVTLTVEEVTSISATLGSDQLRAGILAGLLGLILVGVYLLVYYRFLGLVAVFSLILAGVIIYYLFVAFGSTLGLTLSLAGIAGAIVAIGITADSFIVYFERIRDEIRDGRTLRQATESGWVRARRTLLAADFVSLLAAIVLYWLSVGGVRGFAFVLGLTTLIDVLIAFLFTYPATVLFGRTAWMQKGGALTGLSLKRLGVSTLVSSGKRTAKAGTKEAE